MGDDTMLVNDLGYRVPGMKEVTDCVSRSFEDQFAPRYRLDATFKLPAAVLSTAPLISFSGIVPDSPLGVAGLCPPVNSEAPRWFLLSPTWSIETEKDAIILRINAVLHRLRCPSDQFVFVCNTRREMELLHLVGEAAVHINKTCGVSEQVYRPLAGMRPEFSAIYNAQLALWKRHELTLDIESCLFIFYRGSHGSSTLEQEKALFSRHAEHAPGHRFVNELDSMGKPVRISPEEVNFQLNKARVGLCLSEIEGAMYSSVEYLLAGLPVVTTPSKGGRDTYFDDHYCITAEPNAADVNEAVNTLIARDIARQEVRDRTLQKLKADRKLFVVLLNDISSDAGSARHFTIDGVFGPERIMEWEYWRDAVAQTGVVPL